jgi:tetratricopeptide (TPR) repeat protein
VIRKTINWTVLAVSLGGAVILASSLFGLHHWQLWRLSRGLVVVAEEREQQEKWHEAAAYFDRYLRVHPRAVDVRGRLATAYAKGASTSAERTRAIELHYRALAGEPGKDDGVRLRAGLARLLVEAGRLVEAEREARRVLEDVPEQPEAMRNLALALLAQWENGSLAAAKLDELRLISTAEKARQLNPADAVLAEVTASFYRDHASVVAAEFPELSNGDRQARADSCLDQFVFLDNQNPQVYLARFRYRTRYQLPGAADDIAKALELAPTNEEALLTAAKSVQLEAQRAQEAGSPAEEVASLNERSRELYQTLLVGQKSAKSPNVYLGLGEVLAALGRVDDAVAEWRSGLKHFVPPTIKIAFLSRIAEALLRADRVSEASDSLDTIDTLVGSLGSSVGRDERLPLIQSQDLRRATWHMQRNEISLAVPLLQEVVARQGTGTSGNATAAVAWNLLGRAQGQMGDWREAAVAFDRAAPLDPTSHVTRLTGSIAWLQVGRPDLAVDRAEQSLLIRPTAEAMIVLATAEHERQRMLPANQRSWERLDRTLQSLERDPELAVKLQAPWQIDFLRADLMASRAGQEGQELRGRNEAITVIERAESKYVDRNEFWRLATGAYQRLGDAGAADKALARYAALTPSVADQAITKSRLAVQRNDLPSAQRTLEEAAARAAAVEQAPLRQEMITVALAQGDLVLAERLFTAEAKERRGDVQILRRACEVAVQRGDTAAIAQWQQALRKSGALGAWWDRYFVAAQLVAAAKLPDDPRLSDALEEINKLTVIRPHWPMPYSLRGIIEERRGRLEEAVGSLEHAIQLGERRTAVFEQLVSLLDRLKRTADAERYLSQLEANMPFSQRLTEIATSYELRRDHPEQAISIARAAVDKRPEDAFAHLWLARLLLINKQYPAAEAEFRKTLQLAPDDIRAWNGLFTFYLRSGNPSQARLTLDEIRSKAKLSAADRSFVLAQGYEMLGDWQNATSHYESATAADPNQANILIRLAMMHLRSDPSKAEQTLRRALEVDAHSATARRMLAALLAGRGDAQKFQEAESLLNQSDPATAAVPAEDRRLNALLLAQYGDVRQVAKAAEILEAVIAKPNESVPGDRLILAQIYENQARTSPDPDQASAKRNAAQQQLVAVASRTDAEPAHLAVLIDFLLRNNQPVDAENWLVKLETLLESRAHDEPASISQLIELRLRQGNSERCEKWLRRQAAADSDPFRPTAIHAMWLAAQKRTAEIESLVEPVATELVAAVNENQERGRRARIIGDLYSKTSLGEAAERWYKTAAHHDPTQFPAQVRALVLNQQSADAIGLCRDQAQRDRTSQAAIVLAAALSEAKIPAELQRDVDTFLGAELERHAGDPKLLYAVGTLRAVQGRYDEAVSHYRAVLKVEPRNVLALNNLATMLAEAPEGRPEALKLVERAIEIAGQEPGLLDTKGTILIYQGEAKQAVFLLEAAAREAGRDIRHQFHLAAAYQGIGEVTKAKQQLQAAIEQNLDQQVLTPTDRRLLLDLKASLIP